MLNLDPHYRFQLSMDASLRWHDGGGVSAASARLESGKHLAHPAAGRQRT
jgi:hypothetical protein